jgi:Asp-tRNA(Asn)/Glu-tRNA(Gln) amidotransferase B subunit
VSEFCSCGCGMLKSSMPVVPKKTEPEKTVVSETPVPPMRLGPGDGPFEGGWLLVEYSDGSQAYRFTGQALMFLPENVLRTLAQAGVSDKSAEAIVEHTRFARLVWACLESRYVQRAVNLMLNEVLRVTPKLADHPAGYVHDGDPDPLATVLTDMIDANLDSGKTKKVTELVLTASPSISVGDAIKQLGFDKAPIAAEEIANCVRAVLAAHPDEAAKYKAGKKQLAGFFVGKVMKELGSNAAPPAVKQEVEAQLA